jgi:flagellar brake protein
VNSRACSRPATLVEAGEAHLRHPASRGEMLTRRVLDVSVGDCALQLPTDATPIRPGMSIDGVRLELDADMLLVAPLVVQHVSGGFGSTTRVSRLDCSLARLDGTSQRALQRHIDLAQRRKKFCCWGDPDTNNCRKHHNGSSQASAKMKSITACAVRGHRNLS